MSEVSNIQENVTDCINLIITNAKQLEAQLKRAEFGERNMGRDLIQDIIVVGYCTMYMSGMTSSSLQQIIENTLEYFKTGLYDTDKISHIMSGGTWFHVRSWVYTPDTHNDAGGWFHIFTFDDIYDADECITMLKEIEAELKKLY